MKSLVLVSILTVHGLLLMACGEAGPTDEIVTENRPERWASPVDAGADLPNLFRVSDELLRGAQPTEDGFSELKKMGVKTVVNLRTFHSDRDDCQDAGLKYVHIAAQAWEGEDEELIEFLRVVSDPENQPVFVHCLHGADRAGVMSAAYRIFEQGWSKDDAICEMTEGGFGFHGIWQNLINYVEELDTKRIRQLGSNPCADSHSQMDQMFSRGCEDVIGRVEDDPSTSDRFHLLAHAAKCAFDQGDIDLSHQLASDLLGLAPHFSEDWSYGNAIHDANVVLGRITVLYGNSEEGIEHLRFAGDTPGSPQLNSFGPSMTLARDLLCHGEWDAVYDYLEQCRRFWSSSHNRIDEWQALVSSEQIPDFGANLYY